MKKLSFLLVTLMLLTALVSSFSIGVGAAGALDAFTEVAPPAEDAKLLSTTWNYTTLKHIESMVGEVNTLGLGANEFNHNNIGQTIDCDQTVQILELKDEDRAGATSVKELVFGDLYTSSGMGDHGRIKATPETFEKLTVVYSDDRVNWTEVPFTVGYHTTDPQEFTAYYGTVSVIDTYWHLIFDYEVPAARYFAIHSSETKAWDADDHYSRLNIYLTQATFYAVKGSGDPVDAPDTEETEETEEIIETTEAPVTDPETTEAPVTDPVTTEAPATAETQETDDTKADAENDMTWLYIVIAVAVVAVVVIVIVVAKKKK